VDAPKYQIENFAMGEHRVPSCDLIELRMEKIKIFKLKTLDKNMRVWKQFKEREYYLLLIFIYPFAF
jgi:hypothetical protein